MEKNMKDAGLEIDDVDQVVGMAKSIFGFEAMEESAKKRTKDSNPFQGISFLSAGIGTAALSMIPVTISKAVSSFQAMIVHFFASKGSKRLKVDSKERFSNGKLALLLLTTVGIVLTIVRVPLY